MRRFPFDLFTPIKRQRAWRDRYNKVIAAVPGLAGFGVYMRVDTYLHIEAGASHAGLPSAMDLTPAQRLEVLRAASRVFGQDIHSMLSLTPCRRVAHWIHVPDFDSGQLIIGVTICACHDTDADTVGEFEDADNVIGRVVGQALREMAPPEHHAAIGQAEAMLDAAQILNRARP